MIINYSERNTPKEDSLSQSLPTKGQVPFYTHSIQNNLTTWSQKAGPP